MGLTEQSDTAEDSQGRQLRVNKKLSKAISSVPRFRFQKPRPNLSGSKRSDSSSVPPDAHKTVSETPPNRRNSSTSNSKTNEVSQSKNYSSASELKTNETFQKKNDSASELKTNETVQNRCSKECDLVTLDETAEKQEIGSIANEIGPSLTETCNPQNAKKDTFQREAESTTLNIEEALCIVDDRNATALNIDATSDEQRKSSSVLNTDALLKRGNDQSIIFESPHDKLPGNQDILPCETPQVKDNTSIAVSSSVSERNPPEQERNNTANVPPSVTDKSSKYPHLTSILLSKKRTEPKKEIQHKRRRKFRKGDAIPERSKMTMADWIYWNPTNTDECPEKNSTTLKEVSITTNTVEEEAVDGDVGENNMFDSVPKLVITEDGEINIDQTSLIVPRSAPKPILTEVVGKEETTYSSFRKRPLTKHWSAKDTTIFYKALSLVGTDFALMEKIFPHRTRRELKQKFKREEKFNIDLINRAMYESQLTFDANTLEDLIEHLNNISDVNTEDADDFRPPARAKKSSNEKQKTTKKAGADVADRLPREAQNNRKVINKRKRKTKKLPEDFLDFDDENSMTLSCEETVDDAQNNREVSNKRKRKTKKLPEDFLDFDNENSMTLSCEETVDAINEKEKSSKKRKRTKSLPGKDDIVSDNDEVLEVCVTSCVENSHEDEFETSVPIEYVEDIDSVTDSSLLNNVMAFEVVTSQTPETKKKKHLSKVLNKNQTVIPVVLSSTNYTPS